MHDSVTPFVAVRTSFGISGTHLLTTSARKLGLTTTPLASSADCTASFLTSFVARLTSPFAPFGRYGCHNFCLRKRLRHHSVGIGFAPLPLRSSLVSFASLTAPSLPLLRVLAIAALEHARHSLRYPWV